MFTSKIVFLFLLLYHSCYYSCKPLLAVFIIVPKLTNYSANLTVFRDVMTRPPLEDMLCVDLSYLIFRTCLALIKAMMVCMAKDLLVYTAAMAVGVINRKVIYTLAILFIECCFWTNRLVTRSRVDGAINGHRKWILFCIKCVFLYIIVMTNCIWRIMTMTGLIVYAIVQPHEPILFCIVNTRKFKKFPILFDITSNMK